MNKDRISGKYYLTKPNFRGKILCFLYNNPIYKYEPILTIGPDYIFSIIELVLYNFIIIITTDWNWTFYTNIVVTLLVL